MNLDNDLDVKNLRYILFLIDTKIKDHDGKVYTSLKEAKEYARDTIIEGYADKAVIGVFLMNKDHKEMPISMIQTIGFSGDKKNENQLELFKNVQ